jgi:hypothetical protein
MSKRWIKSGSTLQTIDLFIMDTRSATGAGLTGLTSGSSGLTCYYRKGATGTAQQLPLASQTVGGSHADGGFVAIDGTNMPGLYRLDLSNTMVASEGMLTIMLKGATNMAPVVAELEIVDVDILDSVRFGLSALPNADFGTSTGLRTANDISDAVLSRNVSNVQGTMGEHTLGTVILAMLESAITGTGNPATLTIYRTDGTTTHVSKNVNTTAASTANVITSVY